MISAPKNIAFGEILFGICLIFSFNYKTYFNVLKNIFFLKNSYELFFFIIVIYVLFVNFFILDKSKLLSTQGVRDFISFLFIFLIVLFSYERKQKIKNFYLHFSVIFGWVLVAKEILIQVFYGRDFGSFTWLNSNFGFADPLIYFSLNYLFLYLIFSYKKLNFLINIIAIIFLFISSFFLGKTGMKLFFLSIIYFFLFYFYSFYLKKILKKVYYEKILLIIFFLLFISLLLINNFNNRHDELLSVFTDDFIKFNLLTGLGMGSKYFNIVIGDEVSFTHSIFSYFIFKIGAIGFLLLLTFLTYIYKLYNFNLLNFKKLKLKNNLIIHSFIPILLSSFFYTNFKTISFWLLCGIVLYYSKYRNNENY